MDEIKAFENKEVSRKIESPRHGIAGHIEKNFNKYYNRVVGSDSEEAALIVKDFLPIITEFQKSS